MGKMNNSNEVFARFLEDEDKQLQAIYPGLKIPWEKSKDSYWNNLERKIDKPTENRRFVRIISFSAAASILLIFSIFSIMKFSTTTVQTVYGAHQKVQLPDGSEVDLNAGSKISYHKFSWAKKREVCLNGEAFFNVKKGNKFSVKTTRGIVTVLGTSFNVYDRDDLYMVACITGRVRVNASNEEEVILSPNQKFNRHDDQVEILKNIDPVKELSWINNSFAFNAVPLSYVFKEIERQYNVKIEYRGNIQKSYSGVFPKSSIENVLDIVCRPFGYKYQTVKENEFLITNNNNF